MRRRDFLGVMGGAASWPLVVHAQQPAIPVIGFMDGRSPEDATHLTTAFRQGLGEGGFVEGQNVVIEYRWALGQYDRSPAQAAELLNRRVAVLVGTGGDVSAVAAKQASATIPVVFGMGGDPVKAGLVESFNRPGGNATGFTLLTNEMEPKRLGMLHDLMPGVAIIGVLLNPNFPPAARQLQDLEEAAQRIRQRLFVVKASNDGELNAAFTSLVDQRIGALLVAADPYFDTRRDRLVAFAEKQRLPAIYQFREYAVAGGLISYGPNIIEMYREAGVYTARILKGEKPSNLPVLQPTKFEFVINLKTAQALGIVIPAGLISFADEVIE